MQPESPTLEELESIRKLLIQKIEEAEQMFVGDRNGHELVTGKAAVQCVEDAIRRIRDQEAA